MSLTARRKRRLCQDLLSRSSTPLGFADVGSGGPLKPPWCHLDAGRLTRFAFEPTEEIGDSLPLCVSDSTGIADFFVAKDERGSSLLQPRAEFVDRFAQTALNTTKTIKVMRTTLDKHLLGRYCAVDAVDVNVEGHDLQVLRGATELLDSGAIKLLKVEFELAEVWSGQGSFGEIEQLLRNHGYDLVDIEIDFMRPANAGHVYHRGEPVWGKALYAPSAQRWQSRIRGEDAHRRDGVYKAVSLYAAAEMPGRCFDVIDLAVSAHTLDIAEGETVKSNVARVFQWSRAEKGLELLRSLAGASLRRVY